MKLSLPAPELSRQRLERYRRLGVEAVTVPHHLRTEPSPSAPKPLVPAAASGRPVPQPAPPDPRELRRIVARVRSFDLQPQAIAVRLSTQIVGGGSRRAQDLATFAESVRIIGDVGIGVITLDFTRLRASEGYRLRRTGGRGRAAARDFDVARVAALPPLPQVGEHGRARMWERLVWFLERAVPVAAAAGVRFAIHPNDPPVAVFRGVAQPLCDLASLRRMVACVDDPANGIFLDTGVATEWGEDAVAVADWFAVRDRVSLAHVRNVRVEVPGHRYVETFIDDGDADLGACVRVLARHGYAGGIDPDHTPRFSADDEGLTIGWAWALGTLAAWRDAAQPGRC